jgi:hypothetical protein
MKTSATRLKSPALLSTSTPCYVDFLRRPETLTIWKPRFYSYVYLSRSSLTSYTNSSSRASRVIVEAHHHIRHAPALHLVRAGFLEAVLTTVARPHPTQNIQTTSQRPRGPRMGIKTGLASGPELRLAVLGLTSLLVRATRSHRTGGTTGKLSVFRDVIRNPKDREQVARFRRSSRGTITEQVQVRRTSGP